MRFSDIHVRATSQEVPQPSINTICWKITDPKLHSNFSWANELSTNWMEYPASDWVDGLDLYPWVHETCQVTCTVWKLYFCILSELLRWSTWIDKSSFNILTFSSSFFLHVYLDSMLHLWQTREPHFVNTHPLLLSWVILRLIFSTVNSLVFSH